MDWRRRAWLALVIGVSSATVNAAPWGRFVHAQNGTAASPRPIPEIAFADLKPDATLPVELRPGAAVALDALWIAMPSAKTVVRVDAKKNTPDSPIDVGATPCGALVVAFETVWVPTCDAGVMKRIDVKSGNLSASAPLSVANLHGVAAMAAASVWIISDAKGVISRVDPATNAAVAEVYLAAKPQGIAATDDAVWVTSGSGNLLTRINPHTNVVVATVKVGPQPGPVVLGEGAVWTLNRGDGSVSRVDAKTNKPVTTIAVGATIASGDLAVGEGSVWVSAPGVPITRIDPRSNRVVQRFVGNGGGAIVVAHGSLWVAVGPNLTWRLDPKLVAAMRP